MGRKQKPPPSDGSIQIWDGKWYRLGMKPLHQCCHCALVHEVDHKIERGVVFERWREDKHETRKMRKLHHIKVIKEP